MAKSVNSGNSEVITLKKPEHVVIYKIVERYGRIKRAELIRQAKKVIEDILRRDVSVTDDAIINNLRQITDSESKRSKLKVLMSERGYYIVKEGVKVEPDKSLRGLWEDVDKYLSLEVRDKFVREELRIRHTQKIKERVIVPWLLEYGHDSLPELYFDTELREKAKFYAKSRRFGFRTDPYYEDLKNHLPEGIDPFKVEKEMEEKEKEIDVLKFKMYPLIANLVRNRLSKHGYTPGFSLNNSMKSETLRKGDNYVLVDKFIDEFFSQYIITRGRPNWKERVDIVSNSIVFRTPRWYTSAPIYSDPFVVASNKEDLLRLKEIIIELCGELVRVYEKELKKLLELTEEVFKLRNTLIRQLRELYLYEVLPGSCKYITG